MDQGTDAEFGNLTRDEFQTLTRLAMKALWGDRQLRRAIQAAQINVIPCNFYSDIPSVEEIERGRVPWRGVGSRPANRSDRHESGGGWPGGHRGDFR